MSFLIYFHVFFKRALRSNLEKLKEKIEQGRVGQEILNEYKTIFKKELSRTRNFNLFNFKILNFLVVYFYFAKLKKRV